MISYAPSKGCIRSTLLLRTLWHQIFSRRYSASLLEPALKNLLFWILSGDTVLSGTAVCMMEMHMLWGKQTNISLEMYSLLQRWVCCRLLPGSNNRREGGQGVVVFATSKFTSDTYAIKFFVFQRHFEEERAMYEDGILGKVLPEVRSKIVLKSRKVKIFSKFSYFLVRYILSINVLFDNKNKYSSGWVERCIG